MQLISEGVYFVNLNQSFSNSHLHWKLKNFVSNKVIKEKNEQSNSNSNQTIVTTTKSSISSSYIDFNDFPQIENETLFSQNHQKTFISEKDDKETSKTKNFQETNQTDKLIQNGKNLKKRKRKTNFTEEVQKSYETNQFPILKNALSSLDRIRDQILPILTLSDSQIEENDSKNMFLDFDVWHSTFDSMKRFQNQDIERETLPISNLIDFKQTIGQDMFDCKKIEPLEIFGKTIVNDLENKELILLVQPSLSSNEKQSAFIIPPESSFDLCSIQDYFNNGSQNQFDVILMDPPWPNRSVARGKKYKTESNYETLLLEEMKIQSILKTDAIVFVWITNKQSIKDFVIDNAFKKWGIEFECEILWLKVNSDLKPIFSLDAIDRRPFESLLIGTKGKYRGLFTDKNNTVLIGIPTLHSRKPNLSEFISKTLLLQSSTLKNENLKCLELFARNLTKGWHSVGNEVIQFQQLHFFEKK